MPTTTPFRTTPQLGPNLYQKVNTANVWYDRPGTGIASPQLGTVEFGNDGFEYIWVLASGTIAAAASPGTQVTITVPAFTAATGAGGFYAPTSANQSAGIASGEYFWARKGATP